MKRSRKTLFALLLALVMTLGLAATAWATEGGVIVDLPDGPVINQPTPEVPEAYKIPFTKVVEQKGAFAPGPKNFSLEAFLPNENGGADTTLYRFSFDTSGTGIGSFSGDMTIPANVLGNNEGFYVREVDAMDAGWTYSDEVYYARFSIDASDGNNVQTLTLYPARKTDNGYVWDRGNSVERMSFTNSYTYSTTPIRREKPNTPEPAITAPKTFDAGVALYGVSALLSLAGTALVIKRKNG